MMKKIEEKLAKKMDERMGPVAQKLDEVLKEEKKQTKILREIRDAVKK